MEERPADRRSLVAMNLLTDPLLRLRNAESLRRLRRLAEGADPMPGGALPSRGETGYFFASTALRSCSLFIFERPSIPIRFASS